MTADCSSPEPETVTPLAAGQTAHPMSRKRGLSFWGPLAVALLCLIQGMWLILAAEPMLRVAGVTLLFPIPGCCYFAVRARRPRPQKIATR